MPLESSAAGLKPGGGVAQLGEHLLCKQGVTGSIPVVSTNVLAVPGRLARLAVWCGGWVVWTGGEHRHGEVRVRRAPCDRRIMGCAPLYPPCGGYLFFISVNQVLVRLWAC